MATQVRTQDGKILSIPDGVDIDAAVNQYYLDTGIAKPDTALEQRRQQVEGMGALRRFGEGALSGAIDVARSGGNMVGLVDDETVRKARAYAQPLKDTTAGKVGDFVGSTGALMAATAPVGGVLGAAGRLVRPANVLTRTLLGRGGQAAAQGATMGALAADPNERLEGAALGGVLGGGIYGGLKGAAKAGTGALKITRDARLLRRLAGGEHIPLHVALDKDHMLSGFFKTLYGLAANDPVGGAALQRQTVKANQAILNTLARKSIPREALKAAGVSGRMSATATDAASRVNQSVFRSVEEGIEKIAGPLKPLRVDTTGIMWKQTVGKALARLRNTNNTKLMDQVQGVLDDAMPPGGGAVVTMEQMMSAMSKLGNLRSKLGGTGNSGGGALVDDVIKAMESWGTRRLSVMNKKLLPNWQTMSKLRSSGDWWTWNNFMRGFGRGNPSTHMDYDQLLRGMRGADSSFARGLVPNQRATALAKRVMVDEAQKMKGAFGTNIQLGPLSTVGLTGGGAMLGGAPGAAAGAGLLPLLSAKTVQRGLTGELFWQKSLRDALMRNPNAIRNTALAGTAGIVED